MLLELDREGGWTADEPCFLLFSPYCGNHKKTVFCLIFLIFTYSRVPLSETKMTKIQSQSKQIQTAWHHVDIGSVSACVRRLAKRAELPLESGEWWEGAADDGMMAAERWHFWPGHIWPLAMLCCSGHGTCCGSWAKNWANFLGLLLKTSENPWHPPNMQTYSTIAWIWTIMVEYVCGFDLVDSTTFCYYTYWTRELKLEEPFLVAKFGVCW